MILDATNLIVGRFATVVAKKVLTGEKVDIVNCENAVIAGNKKDIQARYKANRDRGIPLQGPYYPRFPDRLVRRIIRGMLPYKKDKGAQAYKKVMCYVGVPEAFKDKKFETIKEADAGKLPNLKYITVGRICKELGGK